jgi:DNA repair protein RecN (Recombination protein N)
MRRIASGGERTRIGLAIEIVAAERIRLPSLILDEADVGVGGTTADVVGRLLRGLAEHTQVVCITHAPQIAALGQTHLKVSKSGEQDTRIARLDAEERVSELARMLAGARITDESRDYARTLLSEARTADGAR